MTTNTSGITTVHACEADSAIGLSRGSSRYHYDLALLPLGWEQYDTDQDASYFGVWVHRQKMEIMTYAEGDRSLTRCSTQQDFKEELERMEKFYGPTPPAFIAYGTDGTVTHYIDERPTSAVA